MTKLNLDLSLFKFGFHLIAACDCKIKSFKLFYSKSDRIVLKSRPLDAEQEEKEFKKRTNFFFLLSTDNDDISFLSERDKMKAAFQIYWTQEASFVIITP
jgi:hypothetical protein